MVAFLVEIFLGSYSRRGSCGPGSRTGLSGVITGVSGGSFTGGGGSSPGGIGIGGSSSLRSTRRRGDRVKSSCTIIVPVIESVRRFCSCCVS